MPLSMLLNIPAGTAVRFEPGEEREVSLVAFGGTCAVYGHNSKVNGPLDQERSKQYASTFHVMSRVPRRGQVTPPLRLACTCRWHVERRQHLFKLYSIRLQPGR